MSEHRGNKISWSLSAPKGKKGLVAPGILRMNQHEDSAEHYMALHTMARNPEHPTWMLSWDTGWGTHRMVFVSTWLWDANGWNLPSSKKITSSPANVWYWALRHNNQFIPAKKPLENWFSKGSPIWSPEDLPFQGPLKPMDILTRSMQTSIKTYFELQWQFLQTHVPRKDITLPLEELSFQNQTKTIYL